MISSFRNVNENVIKNICELSILTPVVLKSFTDYLGETFKMAISMGDVIGEELSQEVRETYPKLTITKFPPKLREGFAFHWQPVYDNPRDTNNDGKFDVISELFEPVPFVFRYELNLATKNRMQHEILDEWLQKKYRSYRDKQTIVVFNSTGNVETVFGNHVTGDPVEYTFEHMVDPYRTDGVIESLYELNFMPYVQTKEPEDIPIIQNLFVGLFSNPLN